MMLLQDVAAIAERYSGPKIKTDELLSGLIAMDDRPWGEWRHGRAISGHAMAKLLKPFGIKARKHRFGDTSLKATSRAKSGRHMTVIAAAIPPLKAEHRNNQRSR